MGAETGWHVATVVALCLAVAEGILVLGLARVVAPVMGRRPAPPGVPAGTVVVPMTLSRAGVRGQEPVLASGVDHVVLFVSPNCSGCKALLPAIQPEIEQDGRRWEVVVVIGGLRDSAGVYAGPLCDRGVRTFLDPEGVAEAVFATRRTYPLGFAVRAGGMVGAAGVAGNWGQVHMLAANAAAYVPSAPSPIVGNGSVTGVPATAKQ